MWREWKATHAFEMRFRNRKLVINRLRNRRHQRRSSRASLTRMRRMYGRWVSAARELRLLALIPASRWTHNALKPHYRGWDGVTADHNYNWHDSIHDSVGNPCGNDSPFPCDDNGHGTHTIGTAIGDDGMGNQIGMAPGAKWIGCRNMDQGDGTPARYIECMEFFLAPYPVGGDPSQATRPKLPTLRLTPGSARLRKVVRRTRCKLLSKLNPLPAL